MPLDYADGLVRVGVQSAIPHPETAALLRKLMTERGLPVPPANRTLAQFKELMHTGRDFRNDGTPILQVMPWPVYGKMSDRELEAVYEYLRAIPMINPGEVPASCVAPGQP